MSFMFGILAIGLAIWWKAYWMSGLLLIGVVLHFVVYQRQPFTTHWKIIDFFLQLSWIVAALHTNHALILLGLLTQYIGSHTLFLIHIQEQHKHIENLRRHYQNQTTLLHTLRLERHDFHMHLDAVKHAPSQSYIEKLQNKYALLNSTLTNEENIVSGVLFTYLQKAEKEQIKLTYMLHQPLSSMPLIRLDLVSLISNLLANAVEAASVYQQETKNPAYVKLSCRKQSGIWIVVCQNHSLAISDDILNRLYVKKVPSTKDPAVHDGIGSLQIKQIVEKYHGFIDFSLIDNQFTLKIKIPAINSPT